MRSRYHLLFLTSLCLILSLTCNLVLVESLNQEEESSYQLPGITEASGSGRVSDQDISPVENDPLYTSDAYQVRDQLMMLIYNAVMKCARYIEYLIDLFHTCIKSMEQINESSLFIGMRDFFFQSDDLVYLLLSAYFSYATSVLLKWLYNNLFFFFIKLIMISCLLLMYYGDNSPFYFGLSQGYNPLTEKGYFLLFNFLYILSSLIVSSELFYELYKAFSSYKYLCTGKGVVVQVTARSANKVYSSISYKNPYFVGAMIPTIILLQPVNISFIFPWISMILILVYHIYHPPYLLFLLFLYSLLILYMNVFVMKMK